MAPLAHKIPISPPFPEIVGWVNPILFNLGEHLPFRGLSLDVEN